MKIEDIEKLHDLLGMVDHEDAYFGWATARDARELTQFLLDNMDKNVGFDIYCMSLRDILEYHG